MIFIATALHSEALIFLKSLNLKKENIKGKFSIYSNESFKLIVTGTGKLQSAIGVTFLLSQNSLKNEDSIFNIGICGSAQKDFEIGKIFLINKIEDISSNKNFYPDLSSHPFQEAGIQTHDRPVFNKKINDETELVDMEASGFFEAASFFLKPNKIHLLKIVSDQLNNEKLSREFIQRIFEKNFTQINHYFLEILRSSDKEEIFEEDILSLNEKITRHFKLTVSQSIQIKKKLIAYKIRNSKTPDFLEPFLTKKAKNKEDTKKFLCEIFTLLEKNFSA